MAGDLIKLLPDAIANQIAAGEVVQRPASAVKELLENAIDAGGDRIQLVVKDGGKTLIQVIDNGKGMSPIDARLCFERHATSKIQKADDLFTIKTMGFRGEALASIAAIAQVDLKTRRAEDELGTHIIIEGSEVKLQEACACPKGTSIAVKNLFFNVPARRKFLKSNPVEARHVRDEFQRIALAYHEIFFSVFNDGHEIYHLKSGNIKQRIVGLMRKNYSERLVPVKENTNYLKISGFIGKPEFARKSRGEQFFFVNNRFIKSSLLHTAVLEAYDDLLQKDFVPLYVIYIEMDPARLDVNVHPTKQEIKFEDEQIVKTFINAAVKRALSTYSVTPAIDFSQEVNLGFSKQPANNPFAANKPMKSVDLSSRAGTGSNRTYTPREKTTSSKTPSSSSPVMPTNKYVERNNTKNWQELFKTSDNFKMEQQKEQAPSNEPKYATVQSSLNNKTEQGHATKSIRTDSEFQPFQIHNRYIIYHIKSGIIMMDQQAAHERILFEKYLKCLEEQKNNSQKLMFPQKVQLSREDVQLLRDILPEIGALGYEIEEEEKEVFSIKGIPFDLGDIGDYEQTFDSLLAQFRDNAQVLKLDKRTNLAQTMARHSAIKSGKKLSDKEMRALIDQLFACDKPYIAPNGRRTFITQNLNELDKQFKKKG